MARGYPEGLLMKCYGEVNHGSRQAYLFRTKSSKKHEHSCIPIFTQFTRLYASTQVNIRVLLNETLAKYSHSDEVNKLFPDGRVPVVFTKGKSLGQMLVSSKHGHEC
jgi:hypothetical protein